VSCDEVFVSDDDPPIITDVVRMSSKIVGLDGIYERAQRSGLNGRSSIVLALISRKRDLSGAIARPEMVQRPERACFPILNGVGNHNGLACVQILSAKLPH